MHRITGLWSITEFGREGLSSYAQPLMVHDARHGVMALGALSLLLLLGGAALYTVLEFNSGYAYTCLVLSVLSLHTLVSARSLHELKALYLLGMTLLVVSGAAFVLLAHQAGEFDGALYSSVVLLFMVIPLVPWGLREAAIIVSLIYVVFTASTMTADLRFDSNSLWLLQYVLLASALTTLLVNARNVGARKNDIRARFELENAHTEMKDLSYRDPLTGVWNRRFMEHNFAEILSRFQARGHAVCFGIMDVDNFKQLNDTYGHKHGDNVLCSISGVFTRALGDDGFMMRLGGDEFGFLFSSENPESLLQGALHSLQGRSDLPANTVAMPVCVSIGIITMQAGQMAELDTLLRQADSALYSAKAQKEVTAPRSHLVERELDLNFGVRQEAC